MLIETTICFLVLAKTSLSYHALLLLNVYLKKTFLTSRYINVKNLEAKKDLEVKKKIVTVGVLCIIKYC